MDKNGVLTGIIIIYFNCEIIVEIMRIMQYNYLCIGKQITLQYNMLHNAGRINYV